MKYRYFSLSDHLILAMLAALGIAAKVVVVPLAHMLTGPFFIPGGAVAGGFYMLFLVLGTALVRKRGAALLVSLIQAVLVAITGSLGSHGVASLFTYTAAGLGAELIFLISRHRGCCAFCCFIAGMAANLAGSLAVNVTIFRLPPLPLLLSLTAAALSGGVGGLVANGVARSLERLGLVEHM